MYIIGQLLIVLIFIGIILFNKNIRKEYVVFEYILQVVVPILIVVCVWEVSKYSMVIDDEYWGNTCVKIERHEEYRWLNPCSYTEPCNCTTDEDGNETCDSCCVEACDYVPETYYAYDENDKQISITKNQYYKVLKKWKLPEIETDVKNGTISCGLIGNVFETIWDNNKDNYQIIVTHHTYENKVRYEPTFFYPQYNKDQLNDVYDYPFIVGLDQKHVIGEWYNSADKKQSEHLLDVFNGIYGPKSREDHGQIKVFYFIYKDKDQSYGVKQKDKLQGGNKNEYNLVLNYDSKTKNISWYEVISFYEKSAVKNRVEEYLYSNPQTSLVDLTNVVTDVLSKNWLRREFTFLNSIIKLKPPLFIWITAYIVNIIVSLILIFFFKENDYYQMSY